ncbi:MAG TPA: serine/threonine-protein kinase [Nannocystaceae bacterium]|nr:serine/threonine-protein kinase [Nannocystaceae bacterium]
MLRCPEADVILPLGGRLLDGRFKLLERIGRGGMASVWLARNVRVDRLVAIKLIRPEVARDDDMVARFRSEARAAGRIGHPNICDILDSGRSPIGPYIVMEVLKGASLGELLTEASTLAPPTAVMLVREALRGLSAAHRAGIVHRDLKPENIFLHQAEGGEPMVKLMDFGVAKFTDGTGEARTEHGALLGTPEYMAPEQFRGAAHAEARTDIWAMGAILYRALTGKNAFGGPTVAATLLMVASEQPAPIHSLAPDVPDGLVDIVMKCLAKEPSDRYADVAALDDALAPFDAPRRDLDPWQRVLGRSAVLTAEPPDPSVPTESWRTSAAANERPRRLGTIAAFAAIALALGGYALWRNMQPSYDEVALAVDEPSTHDVEAPIAELEPPAEIEPSIPPPPPREADPTPAKIEPSIPPPPPLEPELELEGGGGRDETTGAADVELEIDDGDDTPTRATTKPTEPPPPDPAGVVRSGRWVALDKPGPAGNHKRASDYCEHLARTGHLGITRWGLPNPAVAGKLAATGGIRKGRYWTSALWHGRAIAIDFPSGEKHSSAATERRPKPLCVARWP